MVLNTISFIKSDSRLLLPFLWAVLAVAVISWMATKVWPYAPGISEEKKDEGKGLALVMILGAIGGFIRWMHTTIETGIPDDFWTWMFKSALTPLLSAALALIFCVTARAGFFNSTTKEGNWFGIYALAGMTGLFSSEAINRLANAYKAILGSS